LLYVCTPCCWSWSSLLAMAFDCFLTKDLVVVFLMWLEGSGTELTRFKYDTSLPASPNSTRFDWTWFVTTLPRNSWSKGSRTISCTKILQRARTGRQVASAIFRQLGSCSRGQYSCTPIIGDAVPANVQLPEEVMGKDGKASNCIVRDPSSKRPVTSFTILSRQPER